MVKKEINLICPINFLGYGYVGTNIFKALVKAGVEVSLFPINKNNIECLPSEVELIKQGMKRAEFFNPSAPSVRIWHAHDMTMFPAGEGKKIGFPIFELDTFSKLEKHQLLSCDEWCVCSGWAKNIMSWELSEAELGMDFPRDINSFTNVVPLGVDTEIFKPNGLLKSKDKTVFLNIGKWEKRKGHDVLVDMFNQAFTQEDNVELWMMCENCFNTQEDNDYWEKKYLDSPLGNKIKLIPRQVTQQDMVRIINKADVGIFPTRAEGWNLEPLEMMACGKHIITTNYSGHTEYCEPINSSMIALDGVEDAYDGKWFFNQGRWGKISQPVIDGFVNEMQLKHIQKQNGMLHQNKAGIVTAQRFSWDNSAEKFMGIL